MLPGNPNRIFDRVEVDYNGCWLYLGGLNKGGYGVVSVDNKSVSAHKLSYILKVGEVPDGM